MKKLSFLLICLFAIGLLNESCKPQSQCKAYAKKKKKQQRSRIHSINLELNKEKIYYFNN
ncbi:MAG: hypothetical protein A2046_06615 [Bacteroidetes bacterium GWA2_30_7]|nr:MAG: hypothetical protein A2046_06615 [Bacteroidetes bacterium GWA2_30_7]